MPLVRKWSRFTKSRVDDVPNNLGVYELGDKHGEILYIGEGQLNDRLSDHFLNAGDPIPGAAHFRV